MTFRNGELNFYSSSIRIIEDTAENIYDFSSDVMSDSWDPLKAKTKVILNEDVMVCDVLLEQDIFAGVGNIIKNEVLYRISLHPESLISQIPNEKIDSMILEARNYSFDFYNWKKNYELRTHWLVHRKKICQRCNVPLVSKKTGLKNRRSYYCLKCQILY